MVKEPILHEIRLASVTPNDIEVKTMTYSKKTETARNTIIAATPVVPVHLKKYLRHPVVCVAVKAVSHQY
jgi:hypothetical protein